MHIWTWAVGIQHSDLQCLHGTFLRARCHSLYGSASSEAMRFLVRYNLVMNKRAKKRLQEAIKKDKLERANPSQKPKPYSPKDPKQQSGFLPRPDKKRG